MRSLVNTSEESKQIFNEVAAIPGVRQVSFPSTFVPMLAALSEIAFTKSGWIYEPKMDGIRGVSLFKDGKAKILSRRNLDLTSQYPALANELSGLLNIDVVVDGEIIALNESGRPSFQHLQQRMNLTRDADVQRAEQMVPAYYFVFDIMQVGSYSLLGVKLAERKKILRRVLQESSRVRILQHFDDDGILAYEACVDNGFEGIVAKRMDAVYEPGRRSPGWIKLKAQQTAEFVLGGFTPGDGWRASTFGSLLLGYYDDSGKFIYAGSVGTGFDDRLLRETMRRIDPLRTTKCPFLHRPVEKRDALWLDPQVIVEIKFMDWTRDGHLRTPVFLRFRDDKVPSEIMKERPVAYVPGASGESGGVPSSEDEAAARAKAAAAIRARRLGSASPASSTMPASSASIDIVAHTPAAVSALASGQDESATMADAETSPVPSGRQEALAAASGQRKKPKKNALELVASTSPLPLEARPSGDSSISENSPDRISSRSLEPTSSRTLPADTFLPHTSTDEVATSKAVCELDVEPLRSAISQPATIELTLRAVIETDRAHLLAREPLAVACKYLTKQEVESTVSQLYGNEKQFELLVQREKIPLTHLDKILWPRTDKHPAILKRDYLRTIAEISPYLLGYLHGRPLTLVRSPDGVRGKRFYQKHWNFTAPEFMDTVRVSDADAESGVQEYLLCNNLATLMFLAQNGVIEYHTFTSSLLPLSPDSVEPSPSPSPDGAVSAETESLLNHPDQLVFDLDLHMQSERAKARPMDDGAFEKTRIAALMLRDVFLSMGLNPFVKTSGKNGVHVVLPVERNVEFEVVRFVADIIRQFMGKAHKDHIALDTESARRTGRVFLDHGPNGRGRTVVAPYSPRFAPEATVSCPLTWEDFEKADPADFHISSIVSWLISSGDPWICLTDRSYDLQTVFSRK